MPFATEIMSQPFPASEVAERLSKQIFSRQGDEGVSSLVQRLAIHWPDLQAAWLDRKSPDGAKALATLLLRVVQMADREDLVGHDIPLRTMDDPSRKLQGDANVCSKIGLTLLEVLAARDGEAGEDALLETVQAMTSLEDTELKFLANLIAIPVYLERQDFDAAYAAAKENRSTLICPTSEFLLYKIASAQKAAGLPVPDGDVATEDLSDRFCAQPFDTLSTNTLRRGGRTGFFACACAGTLPYPLTYKEGEVGIDTLWNGTDIQEIRRSVLDGDYTYCSRTMCPYIAKGTLPKRDKIKNPYLRDIIDNHRTVIDRKPVNLTLGHDPSCNLACPSCRCEIVTVDTAQRDKFDEITDKLVLPLVQNTNATMMVSTDGDPFASRHYRRLIHSMDTEEYADVRLRLLTNGLLFTPKEWESLGKVQKIIEWVIVSIDGATEETYEDLRRPGKWSKITANMDFLRQLREQEKIKRLFLHFVVQKKNFEEMVPFVELARGWKVDSVNFIRLMSLGSFPAATFLENDVSDPRHPLHPRLLEVLRHPVLHEPQVNLLSLDSLQAAADGPNRRRSGKRSFFSRLLKRFSR